MPLPMVIGVSSECTCLYLSSPVGAYGGQYICCLDGYVTLAAISSISLARLGLLSALQYLRQMPHAGHEKANMHQQYAHQ